MKKISLVLSAFLLLSLAAQAQPAAKSSGDTAPLAQLQSEWAAAANANDSAKLTALYAEDAVLMPSNAPLARGRTAIEAVWKGLMTQNPRGVVLTAVDRSISGEMGYESGTYTAKMGPAGATDKGKYLLIVRRGSDGKWLIQDDIFNSDLPCSGAGK